MEVVVPSLAWFYPVLVMLFFFRKRKEKKRRMDDITSVVLDIGSFSLKAGTAYRNQARQNKTEYGNAKVVRKTDNC